MSDINHYHRVKSAIAEGLFLGGISKTEKEAESDARHLIGWLITEGLAVVDAGEIRSEG